MSLTTRKIIFFIAETTATTDEAALIVRIRGNVVVRSVLASPLYGDKLEAADGLAGAIPDSYKTGAGTTIDTDVYTEGDVTPALTAKPEALKVIPATLAISTGTKPLYAVKGDLNEDTEAVTLADVTAATEIAWTTSDAAKATVAAGVVTKVAAGAATITATYTYDTGKTITSTCVVTVS
jgi:hypothetical protein